ncbi:MAG: hypothetical protein KF819_15945 [Labilithrix sp.]|nr:hypothetical protein [Labilithrix sp.]
MSVLSSTTMFRPLASAALAAALLFFAGPAQADKPILEAAPHEKGLLVTVRGVTDYCTTNARTEVIRTGSAIRILRERPSHVSRCLRTGDVSFVVTDVAPGTYTITYERVPLVAPARPLTVATATAVVR